MCQFLVHEKRYGSRRVDGVSNLVFLPGDYPAPRAVLTGHDHEVVCVSVCAELGLVISGSKGVCVCLNTSICAFRDI